MAPRPRSTNAWRHWPSAGVGYTWMTLLHGVRSLSPGKRCRPDWSSHRIGSGAGWCTITTTSSGASATPISQHQSRGGKRDGPALRPRLPPPLPPRLAQGVLRPGPHPHMPHVPGLVAFARADRLPLRSAAAQHGEQDEEGEEGEGAPATGRDSWTRCPGAGTADDFRPRVNAPVGGVGMMGRPDWAGLDEAPPPPPPPPQQQQQQPRAIAAAPAQARPPAPVAAALREDAGAVGAGPSNSGVAPSGGPQAGEGDRHAEVVDEGLAAALARLAVAEARGRAEMERAMEEHEAALRHEPGTAVACAPLPQVARG